MANLNGTIEFPQGGSSYKTIRGKIEWEETAIDSTTSPARSKVHTKLYAKTGTGGTTGKGWNGYVQVGSNARHSFSSVPSSMTISSSYKLLREYDDWVEHNDDGSKTVTISGKVAGPSGTSISGVSSSGSGSATLTNIPQASTITSVTSGTTDYTPVVTWTPKSVDFKYKIRFKYGSKAITSDLNISPNTTNEVSYPTVSLTSDNIADLIPNSPSITLTAELDTYNSGGTKIGTTSSKNFTVTLNSSVKPTANIGAFSDVGGLVPSSWGILVQGKSKLSFSVSGTPGTGSSIKSYSTSVAGNVYNTQDITTDFLSTSGSAILTVTDNRDRIGTASREYTVYQYSKPSITKATAERCLENGTLSDNGTYLKYSFASTISSCNGNNTATYQLGYKTKNASSYTYVNINNDVTDVVLPDVTFSANISYEIQFRVTDAFNEVTYENSTIGSGFRLVHYNSNKKALAIGKSSEATGDDKLLEVALPIAISSDVTSTANISAVNLSGGWEGYTNDLSNTMSNPTEMLVLNGTNIQKAAIPSSAIVESGTIVASTASGTKDLGSFTSWSWKTVPLTRVIRQVNSSFALEGNFLVNKSNKTINVLVSANGMFYSHSGSSITYDVGIFNNKSMVCDAYLSCNPQSWNSVQLSPFLLSINPGDKISLTVRFANNTTASVNGEATFITIQELEVPVFFGNDSAIVESGSNANGSYVKYSDGRMECYKRVTQKNVKLTNTWYGLYTNENDTTVDLGNYAATFIKEPIVNITYMGGNGCWLINNNYHSASSPGQVQLCTVSSRTIGTCILDVTAKGYWK